MSGRIEEGRDASEEDGDERFGRSVSVAAHPIVNLGHEPVRLADATDRDWIDAVAAERFSDTGRPPTESRFMVGLPRLTHIYGISDEGVCERWA